jgi:hypothetical protein
MSAGSGRHQARVLAGEWYVGRRLAPSGDNTALYGMQKVRGSNPLSSTLGYRQNCRFGADRTASVTVSDCVCWV